jgi:hypothetical protein
MGQLTTGPENAEWNSRLESLGPQIPDFRGRFCVRNETFPIQHPSFLTDAVTPLRSLPGLEVYWKLGVENGD